MRFGLKVVPPQWKELDRIAGLGRAKSFDGQLQVLISQKAQHDRAPAPEPAPLVFLATWHPAAASLRFHVEPELHRRRTAEGTHSLRPHAQGSTPRLHTRLSGRAYRR